MGLVNILEFGVFCGCLILALYTGYRYLSPRQPERLIDPFKEPGQATVKASSLKGQLATLNIEIRPLILVALISSISICVLFGVLEIFPNRHAIAGLSALACLMMSLFVLNDLSQFIRRRFEERLVDALDLICAAVTGGLAPRQALLVSAEASSKSVNRELVDLVMRLDYGLSIEQSVEPLLRRYNSEGVRLFCQALIAKWHSGSDFGLMLTSVSNLIRDQIRLRSLIIGQLSGARYAAIFTGLLPYLLVPVFLWKQPDWFLPLHNSPNGASYLLGAIFLQLFAFIWLRRLLSAEL